MRHWIDERGYLHNDVQDTQYISPGTEVIPVVVGSLAWAAAQWLEGKRVSHLLMSPTNDFGMFLQDYRYYKKFADGWYLLPPSPPPLRRGERCRWWRGQDSGTGTYQCLAEPGVWDDDLRHVVKVATVTFAVETVKRIEGGEG